MAFNKTSRRNFLKTTAAAAATAAALPTIVPLSVFGAAAPSNRVTIGCVGVGRMGRGDLGAIMRVPGVQVLTTCDVDSVRAKAAAEMTDRYQKSKSCKPCGDFREVSLRDDIDAVQVATPDHWHILPAIDAVRNGKDVFVQKPLSLTIAEGRALADAVERYGRIGHVGSQQRSDTRFRHACELVRNGRLGKLLSVKVGLGTDPGTTVQPVMPVPENLNYDMWLGPAPWKAYTEKRVHPEKGYGRPGWLRISDYGAGMITGWGAHHMDIAHWGMGMENSGPIRIEGAGEFPKDGLWDVHGNFSIDYVYPGGIPLNCTDSKKNPQGVRFEGDKGWVFVRRGFIDANPKSLLKEVIGPDEIQLYRNSNHKQNWIDGIRLRKKTVAPIENGHRSCTSCLLGDIAMRTGQKLEWDPATERFTNSEEANRMIDRPMRGPWRL
ncbi:MAG: Gfo/Idh/MocA family oxidoreductase [Phycisphaerae bacterium]|nr:Gfo/Idh/MocA family oxidoreductase [Phycisphaerae bacterium]